MISLNAADKPGAPELARMFHEDGFSILATGRTCELIENAGIPVKKVPKLSDGIRPNIRDYITNGEIQLIINTPSGKESVNDDSYLRKDAIKARIPFITTLAAAKATAEGIKQMKRDGNGPIHSLQEWHKMIRLGK